jgi:hypothetical protein
VGKWIRQFWGLEERIKRSDLYKEDNSARIDLLILGS